LLKKENLSLKGNKMNKRVMGHGSIWLCLFY
jgi:hypothetical protein